LRLEDIDWQKEILRVRHSKTGAVSELPLLREPGEAVLSYLEKARPESKRREVFLQLQAPYQAFSSGDGFSRAGAKATSHRFGTSSGISGKEMGRRLPQRVAALAGIATKGLHRATKPC
jgi:integrase